MNPHLSPSIVCHGSSFESTAQLLNELGCTRAHIDLSAGFGIQGLFRYESFGSADRSYFRMPVDVHVFDFRRRWEYRNLPLKQGDCLILHMFPWVGHRKIGHALRAGFPSGVARGLSLDVQSPLSNAIDLLPLIDVFMVMGIEIGGRGIPLNEKAVADLQRVKKIISAAGREVRLGIDGGVNAKTFSRLTEVSDTLVVGGLLFNSPDIAAQWNELNRWITEGKNEQG